jgi:ATP-dependent helicase/nuclease subunit A
LPLSMNFRSQPAILGFVNRLFGDAFGTDEKERYEPLRAKREQLYLQPAIEFLWAAPPQADAAGDGAAAGGEPDPTEPMNVHALRVAEAEWIARRLRGMIDDREKIIPEKMADKEELRAVEYGDIAILFRSLESSYLYEDALERYGIPYYVVGGKAFYAQQEVFDLLNFLRTIDSTCDDVALAGVLRSPFFSLRDDTLFFLAQQPGGVAGGLFAPVLTEDLTGEERRRAEFAATTLRELRQKKNRLPIAALMNEILSRTAYDAILTAEFLGERKLANLRKLVEIARGFDQSQVATLADFITWLGQSVSEGATEAPAAIHAEKSPVVRLMTIHQSKGLEFPIVVVPDLQRKTNDRKGRGAFDPRLGPLVVSPPGDDAVTGMSLFRFVEQEQDEAESVRLFYVAVTRAADYLILSSGVNPNREGASGWRAFLGERFDLATGVPLVARPNEPQVNVRVTSTVPPLGSTKIEMPPRPDWTKLVDAAATPSRRRGEQEMPRECAPIAARAASRRRFSFSRISGRLIELEEAGERPELATLADRPTLDGATLGTLVHGVLATLDFSRLEEIVKSHGLGVAVRRQLLRLRGRDGEYEAEAAAMLTRFLGTPRAREIANANRLYRELEFVMTWPPETAPTADSPYLQGFLDCLYEDAAGKWRLVDYKSHRHASGNVAKTAEPYRRQLAIYALAVERILGRAPDELVVCFLADGAEHTFTWNESARRDVVEFVTQAIAERRP